jgi:hypothetical protein
VIVSPSRSAKGLVQDRPSVVQVKCRVKMRPTRTILDNAGQINTCTPDVGGQAPPKGGALSNMVTLGILPSHLSRPSIFHSRRSLRPDSQFLIWSPPPKIALPIGGNLSLPKITACVEAWRIRDTWTRGSRHREPSGMPRVVVYVPPSPTPFAFYTPPSVAICGAAHLVPPWAKGVWRLGASRKALGGRAGRSCGFRQPPSPRNKTRCTSLQITCLF